MAGTAATITAKFVADTSNFTSGANEVRSTLGDLSNQIAGGILKADLFKGVISGIQGIASSAFEAYASNERLGFSLEAMVKKELQASGAFTDQSAMMEEASKRAQDLVAWNQKLAIASPFSQEGVAEAFRMAQAYGFNATAAATVEEAQQKGIVTAQRLTQAMIDFASGSGQTEATMKRVALALGQVQAKGKLAGGEVLQLTEAGLNVRQIMADAMGVTTEKVVELQEKGLIPANMAIQAIVKSLETDFGGAASAQANTASGLINSLQDLQMVASREFFGPIFKEVQPIMAEFASALADPEVINSIHAIGQAFGDFAHEALQYAPAIISSVAQIAAPLAQAGSKIATSLLAPIKGVVGAIGSELSANLPAIVSGIQQGADQLATGAQNASASVMQLGQAAVWLGSNIQSVLWPAITFVGTAMVMWASTQIPAAIMATRALIQGVLMSLPALAAQAAAFVANAVAAAQAAVAWAAAVAPIALVAAAVAGVAIAYSNLQQKLDAGAQAVQANTAGNQAAADAMQALQGASQGTQQAMAGQVAVIQQLQAAQQTHIAGLANTISIMQTMGASQEQIDAVYAAGIERAKQYDQAIAETAGAIQTKIAADEQATATAQAYDAVEAARAQNTMISTTATEQAAQASAEMATKLEEELQKKVDAEAATTKMNQAQQLLGNLGDAVAQGLMTAGAAAERYAAMLGIPIMQAQRLIALQAQIAGTKINAQALSDQRTGERGGGDSRTSAQLTADKNEDRARAAQARAIADAERAQQEAIGGTNTQLAHRREELAALRPGSLEYINKQTEIIKLEQSAAKSGASAAKKAETEAKKKAKAEEKLQDDLARVAEQGGNRLIQLDQQVAARRLAAYKALSRQILDTSYSMVIGWEKNDLEIVAADDKRRKELIPREQAEAEARVRQIQYVQQARETAANGDAETAKEVLTIQTDYNQQRAQLDEDYYKYQQQLANDPAKLAALKEQYDQVVSLMDDQQKTEIDLAQQAAKERTQADQDARDQALADAQTSADKIKSASDDQRAKVMSDLQAQASSLNSFAGSWESAASRISAAADKAAGAAARVGAPSGGGGGDAPAAPSGTPASTSGGSKPSGSAKSPKKQARGGATSVGEVTLVGEEGPELVIFDRPGQVIPAGRTSKLLRGGMAGGGPILSQGGDGLALAQAGAAGAGKGGKGPAISADAIAAAVKGAEADYLVLRDRLDRENFQYELDRETQLERAKRDLRKQFDAQTKKLDDAQKARADEIYQSLTGAMTEEEAQAQVREENARHRAATLTAIETQMTAERNTKLAKLDQDYYKQASSIAASGNQNMSDLESFWKQVQIADLSANNEQQRAILVDDYARQIEDAKNFAGQMEDEQGQAREQAASDTLRQLRDQANAQADAEFERQRDALEIAQFRGQKVADREFDRFDALTQDTIERSVQAFTEIWKKTFEALGAGDRFKDLEKDKLAGYRASGGPVAPYRSYLVGERGPEVITMGGRGGNVTPNSALGGITVNIDARGSTGIDIKAIYDAGYQGAQRAIAEREGRARSYARTGTGR